VERLRDRPGCPIMSLVPAMKQAAATTGAGGRGRIRPHFDQPAGLIKFTVLPHLADPSDQAPHTFQGLAFLHVMGLVAFSYETCFCHPGPFLL